MVNYFSPALEVYPLAVGAAVHSPQPAPRYPSPPPGLRALRLGLGTLYATVPRLAIRVAWRLFTTPRRPVLRSWEAEALVGARAFRVPFGPGPGLMTYVWGEPSAPTVVLVHGWDHRAAFWGVMARGLVQAGFRVVAFDGPAHGQSAFAGAGRRTDLVNYNAAIQAVLNVVAADGGGPVRAVVAHSFGAGAVAAQPLAWPGGTLPRLVLLSAPATFRGVSERFVRLLRLPARAADELATHVRATYGASPEAFSLLQNGPALAVGRTLLLHDEADEVVPVADAHQLAAAWPGNILHLTKGLGHNQILRDAAVLGRITAFLD